MGSGEDDRGVIAGSVFGIVCTVCLCIFGLPLVLAGALMLTYGSGNVYLAGIIIIVVSSMVTIASVVLTVLMCCGCCCPSTPSQPPAQIIIQTNTSQHLEQPRSPYPPVTYAQPSHGVPPQVPSNYTGQHHGPEYQHLLQYQQDGATPGQASRPPPFNPHYAEAPSPSAYPSAPPPYDNSMTPNYQQTYPHK